jgi:hypothetical protein
LSARYKRRSLPLLGLLGQIGLAGGPGGVRLASIRVGSDQLASYAADDEAGCVVDGELSRAVMAFPPGSGLTFPRQGGEAAEKTVRAKLPRRCFGNCRSSYPVLQGAMT